MSACGPGVSASSRSIGQATSKLAGVLKSPTPNPGQVALAPIETVDFPVFRYLCSQINSPEMSSCSTEFSLEHEAVLFG